MNRFNYEFTFNGLDKQTRDSLYRLTKPAQVPEDIKLGAKVL